MTTTANITVLQITILNATDFHSYPYHYPYYTHSSNYHHYATTTIHDKIDAIVSRINLVSMLFGVVGNLICMCVFNNKILLKKRFNWYLLMLALVDFVFCFIVFANYMVFTLDNAKALYDLSKFTCYFTDFIVNNVDEYSVYLTLLLSVDRLYAIRRPINIKFFVTYRYQKQLALAGMSVITLASVPYFFLSQREYVVPNGNDEYDEAFCKYELFLDQVSTDQNAAGRDQNDDDNAHKQKIKYVYVIYYNIIIPIAFNILPGLSVVINNLALWLYMKNYTNVTSEQRPG